MYGIIWVSIGGQKMLNNEQKQLLNKIMNDKYGSGAFSGMITNLIINNNLLDYSKLIQKCLIIRLLIDDLRK